MFSYNMTWGATKKVGLVLCSILSSDVMSFLIGSRAFQFLVGSSQDYQTILASHHLQLPLLSYGCCFLYLTTSFWMENSPNKLGRRISCCVR